MMTVVVDSIMIHARIDKELMNEGRKGKERKSDQM